MANLRNESKFYKKYNKTKREPQQPGRKNPKKRPKKLANLRNECKLYKKNTPKQK